MCVGSSQQLPPITAQCSVAPLKGLAVRSLSPFRPHSVLECGQAPYENDPNRPPPHHHHQPTLPLLTLHATAAQPRPEYLTGIPLIRVSHHLDSVLLPCRSAPSCLPAPLLFLRDPPPVGT